MSGRPSRSREDAQIDAQSFLLRDGVRFRTVPCARSGDAQQYRLQLESDNDNIVGLGAIADELRMAGLNLRVEAVENILNTLCGVIPEYITLSGGEYLRLRLRLDTPPRVRDCRLAIETCGTAEAAADPSSPVFLCRRNVRFVGEVQ